MNRGVQISGDTLNLTLSKMLPEESLNKYKLGNCAEVDAVNQALNNGSNINILHDVYMDSNDIVKNMIKMIFEIGISEFYGRLQNYGQRTLDNLDILINYMRLNSITLPDINMFMIMKYDDEDGWGNDFDGTDFSSML